MTIIVPAGPPRKYSGVDDKTKIKLVTEALLKARRTATPPLLLLERTGTNWLNELYRHEVIWALEEILKGNRDLFAIIPHDYLEGASNEAKTLLTGVGNEKWWDKWREAAEDAPVILGVLDRFDNWCEAQLHKESVTIANLSEANRQKVFRTVEAIYQQFELTSKPAVAIGWIVPSDNENAQARTLSMDFLTNKDVVRSYKFNYWTGGGNIEVEINIKQFTDFRADLLAYSQRADQTAEENEATATSATDSKPFSAIAGIRWQDIQMKFLDGHTLKVTAKETTEKFDYKQMGFEDERTRKPNTQWGFLKLLAQSRGLLDWGNTQASENFKKKKQLLSDTLKTFFKIDDDPFYPYKDEKAYRIKFTLKAEGD